MLANIDREVTGASDVQILECKTAGINGARLWKEGVPEYVQLQVQHQLAVTGKAAADVAVLLGGQHLEIHRIERDETLIARLIQLERQFWDYVETDTPPPADGSESAETGIALSVSRRTKADRWTSPRIRTLSASLRRSGQCAANASPNYEKLEAQLKQTIQQAMGEASKAVFETGSVTWKKAKDSSGHRSDPLLKDQPDLAATLPDLPNRAAGVSWSPEFIP